MSLILKTRSSQNLDFEHVEMTRFMLNIMFVFRDLSIRYYVD